MKLLREIGRGWYEYIRGTHTNKALMEKRLSYCDQCPHKRQLSKIGQIVITAINEDGSTFQCGLCGCPLATLTSSPSTACKDGRWPAVGEETYY